MEGCREMVTRKITKPPPSLKTIDSHWCWSCTYSTCWTMFYFPYCFLTDVDYGPVSLWLKHLCPECNHICNKISRCLLAWDIIHYICYIYYVLCIIRPILYIIYVCVSPTGKNTTTFQFSVDVGQVLLCDNKALWCSSIIAEGTHCHCLQ